MLYIFCCFVRAGGFLELSACCCISVVEHLLLIFYSGIPAANFWQLSVCYRFRQLNVCFRCAVFAATFCSNKYIVIDCITDCMIRYECELAEWDHRQQHQLLTTALSDVSIATVLRRRYFRWEPHFLHLSFR